MTFPLESSTGEPLDPGPTSVTTASESGGDFDPATGPEELPEPRYRSLLDRAFHLQRIPDYNDWSPRADVVTRSKFQWRHIPVLDLEERQILIAVFS